MPLRAQLLQLLVCLQVSTCTARLAQQDSSREAGPVVDPLYSLSLAVAVTTLADNHV
jgi:hypothetical protein